MSPAGSSLPPPRDLAAPPALLVAELASRVGEPECVAVCRDLVTGADPRRFAAQLPYLGGRPASGYLAGTWAPYWPRVWGARGLLYVWDDTAAADVVNGVRDEQWRVAEMCLKVAAKRELAEAGDPASALLTHGLARVRAQAVRALGLVGDSEHVAAVRAAADDPEPQVRRAADLARRRIDLRLDLA